MKKEFIIFDLRKSRDDPLSIRVRWDTSLRLFLDQTKIEPRSINIVSFENYSKFTDYGQKAIAEAKKNNLLIEFASKLPSPAECQILLKDNINVKNSNIWSKYVFREAFGITSKDLGSEWIKFSEQLKNPNTIEKQSSEFQTQDSQLLRFKTLLDNPKPLDDKKFIEACKILFWLLENNYIDRKTFYIGIKDLNI